VQAIIEEAVEAMLGAADGELAPLTRVVRPKCSAIFIELCTGRGGPRRASLRRSPP
jgi:hypothetical protein